MLGFGAMKPGFKFCPDCGAPITHETPAGDDRNRDVCSRDGKIFYHNPLSVVGTVAEWEGRILMCRRAIEPRRHFWTLPAGFLELGETAADGAIRETREEARAEVDIGPLFSLINVIHIGQIHMFYRAALRDGRHAPGPESTETVLMDEADIPWTELAFPTVYLTLERYFADRWAGGFTLHDEDLARDEWRRMGLRETPTLPA